MKGFACCIGAPFVLLTLASLHLLFTPFLGLYPLRVTTVQAFTTYVAKTEAQNTDTQHAGPFLWIDGLPPQERGSDLAKLRNGEVVLRRLSISKDGGNLDVPGGMIHDWQGIVFVPGAKLDQVLRILQDYDHESIYYAPDVSKSKIESHFIAFYSRVPGGFGKVDDVRVENGQIVIVDNGSNKRAMLAASRGL